MKTLLTMAVIAAGASAVPAVQSVQQGSWSSKVQEGSAAAVDVQSAERSVPFLGQIPVIGQLFKASEPGTPGAFATVAEGATACNSQQSTTPTHRQSICIVNADGTRQTFTVELPEGFEVVCTSNGSTNTVVAQQLPFGTTLEAREAVQVWPGVDAGRSVAIQSTGPITVQGATDAADPFQGTLTGTLNVGNEIVQWSTALPKASQAFAGGVGTGTSLPPHAQAGMALPSPTVWSTATAPQTPSTPSATGSAQATTGIYSLGSGAGGSSSTVPSWPGADATVEPAPVTWAQGVFTATGSSPRTGSVGQASAQFRNNTAVSNPFAATQVPSNDAELISALQELSNEIRALREDLKRVHGRSLNP